MTGSPLSSAWCLDPQVDFLNHGSFGACPKAVLERQNALRTELERSPVRFMFRELEGPLDHARERLAAVVGADPEGLAFVHNATLGVNTALADALQEGDEILVSNQEYNASANAAKRWAERAGAHVRLVDLPFPVSHPDIIVDRVLSAVGESTRWLLIDHIVSQTGLVLPIERIIPALRERGVETIVDGAHGVGQVPLALDELGAAYYTSNAHKWLCAPKGSAFLYVREDLREGSEPLITSHGRNSRRKDRSRFRLESDWLGTCDPTPWMCIPESIDFLAGLLPGGLPQVMQHNRELVLLGRGFLCDALGVAAPAPEEMVGSLAAVPLPNLTEPLEPPMFLDPLHSQLLSEGIEAVVQPWPGPPQRLIRISAQAYNHPGQYQRLADRVGALLGTA